jgi:hypothetical protein
MRLYQKCYLRAFDTAPFISDNTFVLCPFAFGKKNKMIICIIPECIYKID